MGLLAPIYLAGLAAISLPLVFHLVRRTPRGRQMFSSLMFLAPSPPRLTRRSRLDQVLLLLLRAAIVALLACAFARPFLRERAWLPLDGMPKRRVAVLVNSSASMRRGDLWEQVLAKVEDSLGDLGPADDVALFTFDDRVHPLVGFEPEAAAASAGKRQLLLRRLRELGPSWGGSDLAAALVHVAEELDAALNGANNVRESAEETQIVLVSDLEHGCRTAALAAYDWPRGVGVVPHVVAPSRTTNAAARLLSEEDDPMLKSARVRVTNAADSTGEAFYVEWSGDIKTGGPSAGQSPSAAPADGKAPGEAAAVAVHVPAGESRVVRLPRPAERSQAKAIVLRGDETPFDNVYFVARPRPLQLKVAYLGRDAEDDPQGLRYYLQLALAGDPGQAAKVIAMTDNELRLVTGEWPQLAIISESMSDPLREAALRFVESGGTLLLVPSELKAAESVAAFLGDVDVDVEQPDGTPADGGAAYLMLAQIDFAHPVFAPFANPRYSDFTKIHFWKHRPLALKPDAATRVVARFDNGRPAVLERSFGAGRALVFASGWRPDDSELALSSKFVPLVQALVELACDDRAEPGGYTVGETVKLPLTSSTAGAIVVKPDGRRVDLSPGNNVFDEGDQPGIYRVQSGNDEFEFAVNLAAEESDTAGLGIEALRQLGVKFDSAPSRAQRAERLQQQRDTELESRQRAWRWLIVTALGVLVVETALAGRLARRNGRGEGGN